jgi:hypothetical protein
VPTKAIQISFALVLAISGRAFADCKEPEAGTKNVPAFSPPLGEIAVGAGRLHSSPDLNCVMTGVFVVPKDELIAYAQSSDGWSSVMYSNPRNGNSVSGRVRSPRLKETGTVGR